MTNIKNILTPVDFSQPSEDALEYAISLAKRLEARVHVVHVYQLPAYTLPDGVVLAGPDVTVRIMDESKKALDGMIKRCNEEGVPVEGHMTEGLPHREIAQVVDKVGADLVVMGTHGRTGLSHLLLGSVAERVIRTSKVPVLTVRPKKTER